MAERNTSAEEYLRRQRLYGGMLTERQQESAKKRQQRIAGNFRIQWTETDTWCVPGANGKISEYPIRAMEDHHLWQTINWAVRNANQLFSSYGGETRLSVALAACLWLREQPLFRALLQEGIRRDFTFPEDIYRYLHQYILNKNDTLDGYEPWHDPANEAQVEELKPFSREPLLPPEVEYGKHRRSIRLD